MRVGEGVGDGVCVDESVGGMSGCVVGEASAAGIAADVAVEAGAGSEPPQAPTRKTMAAMKQT